MDRLPHSLAVVPVAYVLLCRGRPGATEVLLQRRYNTGHFDGHWGCAIAGHVEPGEPVSATAAREAREEVGVQINPDPMVLHPLCVMHRREGDEPVDQRVDFFFVCWDWIGTPRLMEPHKADRLGWSRLSGLPTPVAAHELVVFNCFRAGLVPTVFEFGFESL